MPKPRICKLHAVELKRMRVPIIYGEMPDDPIRAVEKRLFPKANSYSEGGIIVTERSRRDTFLLSCKKCRKALDEFSSLYQAYLNTSYIIDDGAIKLTIRLYEWNTELRELLEFRGSPTWAFLTAYNPLSTPLPDSENLARQADLTTLLDEKRYSYLRGYGASDAPNWEPEPSIFILDITRDAAIDLGKHFNQNAILWGEIGQFPELVWCG